MQDDSEDLVSQTTLIHIFDTAESAWKPEKWREDVETSKTWTASCSGSDGKNAWGGVTSTGFFAHSFKGQLLVSRTFMARISNYQLQLQPTLKNNTHVNCKQKVVFFCVFFSDLTQMTQLPPQKNRSFPPLSCSFHNSKHPWDILWHMRFATTSVQKNPETDLSKRIP